MHTSLISAHRQTRHFVPCALMLATLHTVAVAQNGTWTSLSSGNYGVASNWQGNQVAGGAGNAADFSTLDITSDLSVTLNSPLTIGRLLFGDLNTATGGAWEIRTDDLAAAIVTLDNGGTKPSIRVNPLVPATTFDDAFIGNNLSGTMGFSKLGAGILTLGAGTTNTITGNINVDEGTLRLLGAVPEQAVNLADGTTLETAVTVRGMSVAAGATATVQADFAATTALGGVTGSSGSTLNLASVGTGQIDLQRDWSGHGTVNISGLTDGAPSNMRLMINTGAPNGFNANSFATSHVHLDNANVFVRTNSFGNTIVIGELTGTPTGSLSGGNAGSAARYEIGGLNTSTTFSGNINGAGGISLNKVGTGTLTLSGMFVGDATNQSLAISNTVARQGGVVRVTAGTLAITGATSIPGGFGTTLTTIDVLPGAVFDVSAAPGTFATSALQKVQGGGTVRGTFNHPDGFIRSGDVGAATAANEGNLSSGVVPTAGTITFDGNLQLNGGAIVYDMSLDPSAGNDLVHVTGTTALNSGKITPNFFAGIPSAGTYTVITSDGGFTGSANNITVDFPGRGVDPVAFVSGNNLQFTATPGGGSASLVWTGATNSNWDVETTQNWKNGTNADVFFNLDAVAFNDTAANKAVTITSSVSPSGTVMIDSNSGYTFTGGGAIVGTAGLTKTGSGMLTMQVANTFTGPSNVTGAVDITGFGGGLGAGPLTLTNASLVTSLSVANSSIEIPAGTASTIHGSGAAAAAGTVNLPTLTGDGTLTITSDVDDKWFATGVTNGFTGTLNIQPTAPAVQLGNVRIRGAQTTFPNAVVNVSGVTLANQQGAAAGTVAVFEFGELHGDATATLNAFIGGSTAVDANWVIGGLNTDSDFAGAIVNGAGSNASTSTSQVTKVGTGTLTLTGLNTYTGNTTVQAGKLSITNAFLADEADVFVASGALLGLDFSGDDMIDSLYLGGVPQTPGIWGSAASGAPNVSMLLTGTGRLSVSTLGPVLGVVGDYDNNGFVDAADYVVWRSSVGAAGLPNRAPGNAGPVGQADYDSWRANYGNALAAASNASPLGGVVPEPVALGLAGLAIAIMAAVGNRARRSSSP